MTNTLTVRRLTAHLMCSIAVLAVPVGALAQDEEENDAFQITDEVTTPVLTSETGDLQITGTGSIVLLEGTALTIDSDSDVEIVQSGEIRIDEAADGTAADGAGGVLVTGTERTGSYRQAGRIELTDADERQGENDEGQLVDFGELPVDDPRVQVPRDFADDRFGFRMAAGSFTGDIIFTDTSSVVVDGDTSAGIDLQGDLIGDAVFGGLVQINGANSVGVHVQGNVDGDVTFGGVQEGNDETDFAGTSSSIIVRGQDSDAIRVGGDVTGQLVFEGNIFATGYTDNIPDDPFERDSTGAIQRAQDDQGNDLTDENGNFVPVLNEDNNNDAQVALTSGDGLVIGGDVAGGVLINGNAPSRFVDLARPPRAAGISVQGSGRAVMLGGGAETIRIGQLNETVLVDETPDIEGDALVERPRISGPEVLDENGEPIEGTEQFSYGDFGFINRGLLEANGVYEGVSATTFFGANAIVEAGVRNDGSIDAAADSATATAVQLGAGFSTPVFRNDGRLSAAGRGTGAAARALVIEAGANVTALENNNRIEALVQSDDGDAFGIVDESGSVTSFTNTGIIAAQQFDDNTNDELEEFGLGQPVGPIIIDTVAVDFSANTSGVTFTNTVREDFDPDLASRSIFGIITGDIRFGSGDDQFISNSGGLAGDISFGLGNDLLDLSLETIVRGNVNFGVGDATLRLDNASLFGDATFGAGSATVSLDNGAVFDGSILGEGLVDINVTGGSTLFFAGSDPITLGDVMVTGGEEDESVLGLTVASDGSAITRLNLASLSIADGTEIRTRFAGAFDQFETGTTFTQTVFSAPTLDFDIDQLQLNNEGTAPALFQQTLSLEEGTGDVQLTLRRKEPEELGITSMRAAAFEPILSAVTQDEDLGVALFNATSNEEFLDAFNQVLAGPLDAPLTYVRAQNNAVSSIITQRTERITAADDELRRTFWLQQESYFVDRESDIDSNGFDGGGFVVALGADVPVAGLDVLGVSAHLASARYDEQLGEDFPFNRLTYGVDLYAAEDFGKVEVDGRVGFGWSESDSERNVDFDGTTRRVDGEWEGTQLTANGRIRYRNTFENGYEVIPFVSADYISLDEDAYEEFGDDTLALSVDDREAQSLRANVGVSVGKVYNLRPAAFDTGIPGTIVPRVTAGWSQELITDDIEATYRFTDGDPFTLLSEPENGAAVIGADVDYENQYAKVNVGTSAMIGDQTNVFTLRIGVGLKW